MAFWRHATGIGGQVSKRAAHLPGWSQLAQPSLERFPLQAKPADHATVSRLQVLTWNSYVASLKHLLTFALAGIPEHHSSKRLRWTTLPPNRSCLCPYIRRHKNAVTIGIQQWKKICYPKSSPTTYTHCSKCFRPRDNDPASASSSRDDRLSRSSFQLRQHLDEQLGFAGCAERLPCLGRLIVSDKKNKVGTCSHVHLPLGESDPRVSSLAPNAGICVPGMRTCLAVGHYPGNRLVLSRLEQIALWTWRWMG